MRRREGDKEKDILEAAIKVFAEQGYYQAKIAKIAEVAGIAAGSVYLYFRNKENILDRIFQDVWQKLLAEFQQLDTNNDLTPLDKLEGMIDLIFTQFMANRSLATVFVNEQHLSLQNGLSNHGKCYEKFLTLSGKILKEGIDSGEFNPNLDIHIYPFYVFGGLRYLIHKWAKNPKQFPLEEIKENVKITIKSTIMAAA